MLTRSSTTPTPDEIYDVVMRQCTSAEFKVLSLIVRKTFGWRKLWDRIPLSQFQKATGLSRPTILKGLTALERNGWILSKYQCMKCYAVHTEGAVNCPECGAAGSQYRIYALNIGAVNRFDHLVNSVDYPGKPGLPDQVKSVNQRVVKFFNPQKTTYTTNNKNNTADKGVVVSGFPPAELQKLMKQYGEEEVMKRVDVIHFMNGRIRNKTAYLVKSLQEGWMPELSEKELEAKRKLAELEEELAAIKADNDMSPFPDPSPVGIKRAPEEVKADLMERYEANLRSLKRRLFGG